MNPYTYFRVYQRALSEMETALERRGDRVGIGVNGDYWAKWWQHYERIAAMAEHKLMRHWGVNTGPLCPVCGWPMNRDMHKRCR